MQQTVNETWVEWAEKHYTELGRNEGALRTCREILRAQLEEHFGPLPESLVQRIESSADLDKLKAAILQVLHVNAPDELRL